MNAGLTFRDFIAPLRWIDGTLLAANIEPYRWGIFDRAFQRRAGLLVAFVYTLILSGRAKKNWKTADLVFACLYALMDDSPGGNQVYFVANDQGQAADDLALAKKLVKANELLGDWVRVKHNIIERKDGAGFIEVLPAQDALGSHGKTYRLLGVDEVHGYRSYDLLEALAPDPSRPDTQQWITSYASLFHKPGVPLFDMLARGQAGSDPTMLFSWYAANYCSDAAVGELSPEARANPSMASWGNPDYLAQQQRRLPAHKYRRLHLNLPGLPEGSAFQVEPVMDAIARGVRGRAFEVGLEYCAFVDMSGGSNDDAVLGIGHADGDGRAVLDVLIDQGAPPPFDPNAAVQRFVRVLRQYQLSSVAGDAYAGQTFRSQFATAGISYLVVADSASELYEAFEPRLNAREVVLLDAPELEQQLLGLRWSGRKITHQPGEHDDWANGAAGVVYALLEGPRAAGVGQVDHEYGDGRARRGPTPARRPGRSVRHHAEQIRVRRVRSVGGCASPTRWRRRPACACMTATRSPSWRGATDGDALRGMVYGRTVSRGQSVGSAVAVVAGGVWRIDSGAGAHQRADVSDLPCMARADSGRRCRDARGAAR